MAGHKGNHELVWTLGGPQQPSLWRGPPLRRTSQAQPNALCRLLGLLLLVALHAAAAPDDTLPNSQGPPAITCPLELGNISSATPGYLPKDPYLRRLECSPDPTGWVDIHVHANLQGDLPGYASRYTNTSASLADCEAYYDTSPAAAACGLVVLRLAADVTLRLPGLTLEGLPPMWKWNDDGHIVDPAGKLMDSSSTNDPGSWADVPFAVPNAIHISGPASSRVLIQGLTMLDSESIWQELGMAEKLSSNTGLLTIRGPQVELFQGLVASTTLGQTVQQGSANFLLVEDCPRLVMRQVNASLALPEEVDKTAYDSGIRLMLAYVVNVDTVEWQGVSCSGLQCLWGVSWGAGSVAIDIRQLACSGVGSRLGYSCLDVSADQVDIHGVTLQGLHAPL